MENHLKQKNMDALQQAIFDAVQLAVAAQMPKPTQSPTTAKEVAKGEKINGIRGLATYLGASTSTAQAIKNSGKIPYYNVGNRVFFYSREVDSALRTPSKSEMA